MVDKEMLQIQALFDKIFFDIMDFFFWNSGQFIAEKWVHYTGWDRFSD